MSTLKVLYHRIKQLFFKPTCPYCTLCCEPIYKGHCEVCDD